MYIFHSDGGHGWLAVKKKELKKLGIENEISSCSYAKGDTAYLEEDCDYPIFVKAKAEIGEDVEYKESYHKSSPIRGYASY